MEKKRSRISHGGEQKEFSSTKWIRFRGTSPRTPATLCQPCFSHRNQSQHKCGGLVDGEPFPSTPALPPPAAARTAEIWGLAQATARDHANKTEGKPSGSSRTALQRELGVFPRHSCAPQASPGTCTVPGTVLVPKWRNKGKRGPEEQACQRLANRVLTRRRQSLITPRLP